MGYTLVAYDADTDEVVAITRSYADMQAALGIRRRSTIEHYCTPGHAARVARRRGGGKRAFVIVRVYDEELETED